jgi:hypothetical protein
MAHKYIKNYAAIDKFFFTTETKQRPQGKVTGSPMKPVRGRFG